jgi:regulator of protease activity HflC (stomatin/prohibitin superfamily)
MIKRIYVTEYQVALVMKRGVYRRMLGQGAHWLWNESAVVYDRSKPFVAPVELNVLLQDSMLAAQLLVVDVPDNHIALLYENGLLKQVLKPGKYAYWKGMVDYRVIVADMRSIEIDASIERPVLQHALMAPYVRSVTVEPYQQAVWLVDGKYQGMLAPGLYHWWGNSTSITVLRADMRVQQLEISGQEILTRDKATLRLNAWAQYRVTDVEKALLDNKDYEKQLYINLQLVLRQYVAGYSLDELLGKKDSIAEQVLESAAEHVNNLGVQVMILGIRDIILPGDMKEIMNQVLIAEKKAQANVIMRREETASTRSLLNTAKLMEDNPAMWKLKEMEYVEKIAEKISSISVSGNSMLVDQLKQILVPSGK